MATPSPAASVDNELVITYQPQGSAREMFRCHASEVVNSGPAGTGKSRGVLELAHLRAAKYPGSRSLFLRKTFASLKASTLVTFDERVQPQLDGVRFFGDTAKRPAHYRYPNGSVIVVGGMDKAIKVMSTEYDFIYCFEATEFLENDWESLTTRTRNGVAPFQQVMGDCNPDAPTHWLLQRANAGKLMMLESHHEDNPVLWDRSAKRWTPFGESYMAKLDALSGVRKERLRYGRWAAAEGMIYDEWDRSVHIVSGDTLGWEIGAQGKYVPPATWPRYIAIDFGMTHPTCIQWWALDGDGRMYMYREIYMTGRTVDQHARQVRELNRGEPIPRAVVADPESADGRAVFSRVTGWSTRAANKDIANGIGLVKARLRKAGDGKPRLFIVRDALVERDPVLVDKRQPACTAEEVESYVWDLRADGRRGDTPVDKFNHGMDTKRYITVHLDLTDRGVQYAPRIW